MKFPITGYVVFVYNDMIGAHAPQFKSMDEAESFAACASHGRTVQAELCDLSESEVRARNKLLASTALGSVKQRGVRPSSRGSEAGLWTLSVPTSGPATDIEPDSDASASASARWPTPPMMASSQRGPSDGTPGTAFPTAATVVPLESSGCVAPAAGLGSQGAGGVLSNNLKGEEKKRSQRFPKES